MASQVQTKNRKVTYKTWGGPEVLEIQEVDKPHAGPGELRVHVAACSLNPMDWLLPTNEQFATSVFGVKLPSGFGNDYAGTVDEVGSGVTGFSEGDHVYGGRNTHAFTDYLIVNPSKGEAHHTPAGLDDITASTLDVAGKTAAAAIDAINVVKGDTVLVGGAAGGVGVFAVQLAVIAGARVIGTASEGTFEFLKGLGVEPVAYGDGLVERVRKLAPGGITAATDLFGTETGYAALELGVAGTRISTIAAHLTDPELNKKVKATGGFYAADGSLERIADLIDQKLLSVPIAATFPLEKLKEAIALCAARHVHGKVVVTF